MTTFEPFLTELVSYEKYGNSALERRSNKTPPQVPSAAVKTAEGHTGPNSGTSAAVPVLMAGVIARAMGCTCTMTPIKDRPAAITYDPQCPVPVYLDAIECHVYVENMIKERK